MPKISRLRRQRLCLYKSQPESEVESTSPITPETAEIDVQETATNVPEDTPTSLPQLQETAVEVQPVEVASLDVGDGPVLTSNPGLPGRIAFVYREFRSEDGKPYDVSSLYLMNADGTDLEQLIETPVVYDELKWDPTNQRFGLIVKEDSTKKSQTYLIGVDGSAEMIELPGVSIENFDFLPGGTEIIFVGKPDQFSFNIYRGNLSDGTYEELVQTSTGHVNPAVSPDGSFIAFECRPKGYTCLMDITDPRRQPALDEAVSSNPAWAPGGERVAYIVEPHRESEICVRDLQSGENECWPLEGLSFNRMENRLTWSPDGRYVAFSVFDENTWEEDELPKGNNLFAIDTNSGEIIALTSNLFSRDSILPVWFNDDPPIEGLLTPDNPFYAFNITE